MMRFNDPKQCISYVPGDAFIMDLISNCWRTPTIPRIQTYVAWNQRNGVVPGSRTMQLLSRCDGPAAFNTSAFHDALFVSLEVTHSKHT